MHGLESEWKEKVQFFHINFRSRLGKELGQLFEIEHLPALVLVDRAGKIQWRLRSGLPHRVEIESQMESLV